ncbi:MAG: hypothetical protein OSJ72_18930 [Lachnospiraceae bacterium]|nr:hypothetical protein [Lachnospiraceae bacterium]
MRDQELWQGNECYIESLINTMNRLADDAYIYLLHLQQNRAWFSETFKA